MNFGSGHQQRNSAEVADEEWGKWIRRFSISTLLFQLEKGKYFATTENRAFCWRRTNFCLKRCKSLLNDRMVKDKSQPAVE